MTSGCSSEEEEVRGREQPVACPSDHLSNLNLDTNDKVAQLSLLLPFMTFMSASLLLVR
jgi:hypothetical protein